MLSALVISNQKFILFIDELQRERIAHKFITQLLHEQAEDVTNIKLLPNGIKLKESNTYDEQLLLACATQSNNDNYSNNVDDANGDVDKKNALNIILPTLADWLNYQRPAFIFDYIQKLRKSPHVKRIFLWASTQNIEHDHSEYILAACEHMADIIIHLKTVTDLSIITRKPGGGVTNKCYISNVTKTTFLVTPAPTKGIKMLTKSTAEPSQSAEQQAPVAATFKIELKEDEMVARNALKLPYERVASPTGNIIYTPDAQDDFDEEDPDEDLCI